MALFPVRTGVCGGGGSVGLGERWGGIFKMEIFDDEEEKEEEEVSLESSRWAVGESRSYFIERGPVEGRGPERIVVPFVEDSSSRRVRGSLEVGIV